METKKVKKVKVTFRHEIFQGAKYYRCESIEGIKQNLESLLQYRACPIGTYRHDIVIGSLVSGEMKQWIINTCKKGGEWLHHYNLERWEGKQVTYCF